MSVEKVVQVFMEALFPSPIDPSTGAPLGGSRPATGTRESQLEAELAALRDRLKVVQASMESYAKEAAVQREAARVANNRARWAEQEAKDATTALATYRAWVQRYMKRRPASESPAREPPRRKKKL